MTGKALLKRLLLTLALAAGFLMFLAAVDAYATPIRPDIRKLVEEPQQDATAQSMPARAGWDGPEMVAGDQAGANPSLAALAGARLARARMAQLAAAATPDPRAILGIVAVIFLLRLLRKQEEEHAPAAPQAMSAPMENTEDRMAA